MKLKRRPASTWRRCWTLEKAIAKGGLKRSGDAWMRLALAEHGMQNTQGAIAALQKAVGFDETRKQAGEWLRHLSGQVASQQTESADGKAAGRELHGVGRDPELCWFLKGLS